MPSQMSTAVSDAVLALSALHVALKLLSITWFATVGFLTIAAAAAWGAAKFGMSTPSHSIISRHAYLTWMVSVLGIPSIAAAFCRQGNDMSIANLHLAASIAVILLQKYIRNDLLPKIGKALAGLALGSIVIHCFQPFNMYGLVGAGVYAGASLVILEGHGSFGPGLKRVDVFHYALVLGNFAFLLGLSTDPAPIFYRMFR